MMMKIMAIVTMAPIIVTPIWKATEVKIEVLAKGFLPIASTALVTDLEMEKNPKVKAIMAMIPAIIYLKVLVNFSGFFKI